MTSRELIRWSRLHERRALGWSLLYVFAVLSAYYVLRPIRDEMGVQGGVENLPWLFTGTLLGMLAVNPLFAALVRRLRRERFIAYSYRFFAANLLVFLALFSLAWAPLVTISAATGQRVTLVTDPTQDTRDRRGWHDTFAGGTRVVRAD